MKIFIEELTKKDELTSTAIKASLAQKWPDLNVSTSTIKRVRQQIGWVCTRPHYCQLLREVRICCYESVFHTFNCLKHIHCQANPMLFMCNVKILKAVTKPSTGLGLD